MRNLKNKLKLIWSREWYTTWGDVRKEKVHILVVLAIIASTVLSLPRSKFLRPRE